MCLFTYLHFNEWGKNVTGKLKKTKKLKTTAQKKVLFEHVKGELNQNKVVAWQKKKLQKP